MDEHRENFKKCRIYKKVAYRSHRVEKYSNCTGKYIRISTADWMKQKNGLLNWKTKQ